MYCKACGKQIPDDSAFCNRCGAPQGAGASGAADESQWETCEIVEKVTKTTLTGLPKVTEFRAEAIGPKGMYVADSIEYKGWGEDRHGVRAGTPELQQLIARLSRAGWESLTRGEYWYSHRFRRRVR